MSNKEKVISCVHPNVRSECDIVMKPSQFSDDFITQVVTMELTPKYKSNYLEPSAVIGIFFLAIVIILQMYRKLKR